MTIEKPARGNQHPSGKLEPMEAPTTKLPIGSIVLFCVLLVLMLFVFYTGTQPSKYKSQADLDRETCAGLDGPQCLEKLQLERRRREFIESPEGQEALRAAEATRRSDHISEK